MSRPGYSSAVKGGVTPKSLIVTLAGGPLDAYAAGTWKLHLPEKGTIIGITANVGAKGGTHSVSTIDVKAGATSVLGSLIDIAGATAGTPVEVEGASLAAAGVNIAKDTLISIITAQSGGTSPTVSNLTVQIDYVPTGD